MTTIIRITAIIVILIITGVIIDIITKISTARVNAKFVKTINDAFENPEDIK